MGVRGSLSPPSPLGGEGMGVRGIRMALSRPLEVPAPVTAAAEVIAGLDGCFAAGFGRLGPQQAEALQS